MIHRTELAMRRKQRLVAAIPLTIHQTCGLIWWRVRARCWAMAARWRGARFSMTTRILSLVVPSVAAAMVLASVKMRCNSVLLNHSVSLPSER